MRCIIRGNNIEITDALKDYVEKKVSRLEKYFDSPPSTEAYVLLNVQKDGHKVEVTIPFPGILVRAEELSEDMYASVDLVVEKLERQIRKYKTRVNRKSRQDGSLRSVYKEESIEGKNGTTAVVEHEENGFEIVRVKRFDFKPMSSEEAILQMDLLGHSFFVFSNAATDDVNIIYKRKDGKYGLIEPE
ncbi:ribosome hibernation-promoting factor, HPF/YfiA family [Hazenella coriacea]|uniref:Ribosome hibernation promoting factor n=1 Tax=Hazenella coriacea TaxID=1179467 RepID=A0A4R3L6W7_9BACL|nr:ribosome-associated translation inhibitor RaiA [Hazenella coriacea]TCS95651.1 putative sigma-54 modulation protein [Hazenella coriacea]